MIDVRRENEPTIVLIFITKENMEKIKNGINPVKKNVIVFSIGIVSICDIYFFFWRIIEFIKKWESKGKSITVNNKR